MYPEDRPTSEPNLPWIIDTSAGFLANREAAVAWSKGSAMIMSILARRVLPIIIIIIIIKNKDNTFFDARDSRLLSMRGNWRIIRWSVLGGSRNEH